MISKKKIIAIVSFILMGFVMFTFANPSDGVEKLEEPIQNEQKPVEPVKHEDKDSIEPPKVVPIVVVDNAPTITVAPTIVKVVEGTTYDVKNGVTVTDDKDTDLAVRSDISVIGKNDVKGTYEVNFTVVDRANNISTAKRTIIVLAKDDDEDSDGYTNIEEASYGSNFDDNKEIPEDEAPVIKIDNDVTIEYAFDYDIMKGVEITDDFDSLENEKLVVDTDIKDTKILTIGKHVVTYTATDRKGNVTTITRNINVIDTTAPILSLNGDKKLTLKLGIDSYEELGVLVTDNVDSTIPSLKPIRINYVDPTNSTKKHNVSKVDTSVTGRYILTYIFKDKANNQGVDKLNMNNNYVLRIVDVIDATAPVITGIEEGKTYVNEVSYEVEDPYLTSIKVDGTTYTRDNAPYTINKEGTHIVEAFDSSNNSTKITFNIERKYNVIFVDYNGKELAKDLVKANTSAEALVPNMTGKTYTKTYVTYTFSGWDKDYTNITAETVIKANYDITEVKAVLFELDEKSERPENGEAVSNWQAAYKKLGTTKLKITDEIKDITLKNQVKVLSNDVNNVTNYINDLASLPLPSDSEEKFKKYEFYVIKHELDGWHIDAQSVVDENAKNVYRDNSINSIKKYATTLGFVADNQAIIDVIDESNINILNTKSEIDVAVNNAKNSIDELLKTTKDSAKANVIAANVDFSELYQTNANNIVNKAITNIDNSLTVHSIVELENKAISDLYNLKLLMSQTFVVSLTNDNNNVLINAIASDVKLTKVEYEYTSWKKSVETIDNNGSIIELTHPLDEVYKDVNSVKIYYTKNGKSFEALYDVKYKGFIKKLPDDIELNNNSYYD